MTSRLRNFLATSTIIISLVGAFALSRFSTPATEPIFYANMEDNNHCLQAVTMTVLNTLGQKAHWNEVISETEFQPRLYSWTVAGAKAIAKRIPGTRFYSQLDYERFANEGEPYLKTFWNPAYFSLQMRNASPRFEKEQNLARSFVNSGIFELRKLSHDELRATIKNNLVIALVNYALLHPGSNTSSHFIVMFDADDQFIWLHDPGLPAHKSEKLPFNQVYSASSDLIVVPTLGKKFSGSR